MCGQTVMGYGCPCGKLSRETMPPRVCTLECDVKRAQLTVNLARPCKDCRKADSNIYDKLHQRYEKRPTAQLYDRRLPGMPEPGATDGLPPTYHHATEQPPTYAQAIAEEEPLSYDNVMMAIANFQPDEMNILVGHGCDRQDSALDTTPRWHNESLPRFEQSFRKNSVAVQVARAGVSTGTLSKETEPWYAGFYRQLLWPDL